MRVRLALPPTPAFLALVALAFVLPGLVSHEPWKSIDLLSIEIAHGMAMTGDLLVPRVAGEPWLSDPPLYAWVGTAFGQAFGALFGFHGAVRLASGAFVIGALLMVYLSARGWATGEHRREIAAGALLALLGSVGLVIHAHEATPDVAALFAIAAIFATLPHAAALPVRMGVLCGAALGAAFLASGPIVPLTLLVSIALGAAAHAEWRSRRIALFFVVAVLVAATCAGLWLVPFLRRAPELFGLWWNESVQLRDDLPQAARYFFVTGLWFAWPAWPIAAWTLWTFRHRLTEPRLFVPAIASLGLFAATIGFAPRQDVQLTALLVPLAVLAAQGITTIRRGAAAALDWFGVMTFTFFTGLVWLGYVAMMTGVPPRVANNFVKTAAGFVAQFDALALIAALAITIGWVVVAFFIARSPSRALLRWAAGITLLWGNFALLWLPWVDYQKSYQGVALQLRSSLPPGTTCLASRNLGLPQRAALSYHGGIRAVPWDARQPDRCPVLLVQGSPKHELDHPGTRWRKLADVGRPSDKSERYRLYRLER